MQGQPEVDHGGYPAGILRFEDLEGSQQQLNRFLITTLSQQVLTQVVQGRRHIGMGVSQTFLKKLQGAPITGFSRRKLTFGGIQGGPLGERHGQFWMIGTEGFDFLLLQPLQMLTRFPKTLLVDQPLHQIAFGLEALGMTLGQMLLQQTHGPRGYRFHQMVFALKPEALGQCQQHLAHFQTVLAELLLVKANRLGEDALALGKSAHRVQALAQLHLPLQQNGVVRGQGLGKSGLTLHSQVQRLLPAALLLQRFAQPQTQDLMLGGRLCVEGLDQLAQLGLASRPVAAVHPGAQPDKIDRLLERRNLDTLLLGLLTPVGIGASRAGGDGRLDSGPDDGGSKIGRLPLIAPELVSLLEQFQGCFALVQTAQPIKHVAIGSAALLRQSFELLSKIAQQAAGSLQFSLLLLGLRPGQNVGPPLLGPLVSLDPTQSFSVVGQGRLPLTGASGCPQMGLGQGMFWRVLEQNALPVEIGFFRLIGRLKCLGQLIDPVELLQARYLQALGPK